MGRQRQSLSDKQSEPQFSAERRSKSVAGTNSKDSGVPFNYDDTYQQRNTKQTQRKRKDGISNEKGEENLQDWKKKILEESSNDEKKASGVRFADDTETEVKAKKETEEK